MNKINRTSLILLFTTILFYGCGGGANNSSSPNNPGNGSVTDTEKPHITLQGDKTILINTGEPFTDPGATALDNVDGDISYAITKNPASIDTSIPGIYEIIYSVSDKAGNVDTAKRTVVVLEMIPDPESKKASGIVINEVLATNNNIAIDPDFKQFSDWIELYNNTSNSKNIGGYYLSDDPKNPKKWKLPSKTIGAKQYLLIWADKEDTGLHTNFSLDGDGETLILSDKNGNAIDTITFKKQKRDISVTKLGDTNYYMNPTPGKKNKNALNALYKSKKPTFDKESGFYTGTQQITLSQENGATIYYTTDGSIPTLQSAIFSKNHPIIINKTTVIRARALENSKFLSSTVNHTYLINENVHLPVISVAINSNYFRELYNVQQDASGNYIHPWFRPGSIEYIKDGKPQFNANIGIKIHGNFSSAYAHKSLAIYAKDKYGPKSIDYPLFEQKPYIKKIRSFVLRNSGNDWKDSMIRDGLFHTLVRNQMDIDYAAYQPAVIFVNGEYRGILNIREKENENYLRDNYKVNPDNIDLLENYADVMAGDNKEYLGLLEYIKNRGESLSNINDYNYVSSKIDIDEFINYMITEIYVGNSDWLGKNIRFWKEKKEGAKWRWLLQDLDFGFGLMVADPVTFNTLDFATQDSRKTLILRSLLKNPTFQNKFISRFLTHLNTTFTPNRVIKYIETFQNKIKNEMPADINRWQNKGRRINSYNDWENKIYDLKTYALNRNDIVRQHLKDKFNLTGNNLLHIPEAAHGTVFIDNVKLDTSFNGKYFNNSKVILKAIPQEGYRFTGWSNGNKNQSLELTVNSDITISALFEKTIMPKIVINEINYKSDKDHDSGDWIELYNNDSSAINLSGWSIKDSSITEGYTIPPNIVLQPGSYLVLCEDKTKFLSQYTTSAIVLGNFPFGLSKSEDTIHLYNEQGALADHVHYDKTWPDAKGNGKTLSLIDPNSDNSISTNWLAADNFGTPGKRN